MNRIDEIFSKRGTVAIVGASDNPARPSYRIADYLRLEGFKIIPVNPRLKELFGLKSYPDLISISEPIDIVSVFRNPEAVPEIVEQAIEKGAKVVWMQPGAVSISAGERARAAGLEVVMGACVMHYHSSDAQVVEDG